MRRSRWAIFPCVSLAALGALSIQHQVRAQDRPQAGAVVVTGTVRYNPLMNECFKEVSCVGDVALGRDEDWVPPTSAVNVFVKGSTAVTKTDRRGNYRIDVPPSDGVLVFSLVGFERVEVPVAGRSVVDVRMMPTPLPVVDRLLGLIMPQLDAGVYPDIDELGARADVNRETARDILWLVIGNQPMARHYPDESIPDPRFDSPD
jgi:hypothetical protein